MLPRCGLFFMDRADLTRYGLNMLSGVRICSSDAVWRQILTDLNAAVVDAPVAGCLNFDALNIKSPVSMVELKSIILSAIDYSGAICSVFGHHVAMPRLQAQIVAMLYNSGGMTVAELKDALGISPDVATHTIDNAIYQLRKSYGREFIQNNNGTYSIGKL